MNQLLARRGPDGEGLWFTDYAAFGNQRLAIVDPPVGMQPMLIKEDGRLLVAISYNGEIYNHSDLRRTLTQFGHSFKTRCDTEVVLRAYLQWGTDFAVHLRGMFAAAIWDSRRESLLLLRDPLGIKPLYYYSTRGGVIFGSEPKAILAHPEVEPILDADGLREMLTFVRTPGASVIKGIREVIPGCSVTFTATGSRVSRYWGLAARPHADDFMTTVDTIRELLSEAVSDQANGADPIGVLLSGGLDSSLIAALSAEGQTGNPASSVRAFTLDIPGGVGSAQRTDGFYRTRDSGFASYVANQLSVANELVSLDPERLGSVDVWRDVVRASDTPVSLSEAHVSLFLFAQVVAKTTKVALSGEGADELFGGYAWFHDPRAVYSGTFPWVQGIASAMTTRDWMQSTPLNMELIGRLGLSSYTKDSYATAIREAPTLEGEGSLASRMRAVTYLHLTRYMQFLLDRTDRMGMAAGLEVRVPFCDHKVVEYVFNVPWHMRSKGGTAKHLLRQVGSDLLPSRILNRSKSPYPVANPLEYDDALRRELGGLLENGGAAAALVHAGAAKRLLSSPASALRYAPLVRRHVEFLIGLDQWCGLNGVRMLSDLSSA